MANLDLRGLQIALEKNSPKPLYFVFGEDTFLVDECLRLLKGKVLNEGAVDFNFDNLYSSEANASRVRDIVETLPMMCERRLVFYKEVQALKEKDWDKLKPILENPVDTTTLVLVATKADKRKKYYKILAKSACVVELKRPYENQVAQWIHYIASKQGLKFSKGAAALMHQFVGSNLAEINSEMMKLRLYIGDRNEVEEQDILNAVSDSKINNIFELTNAIGSNDRAEALVCLARLLEQGQSEVGAVALIFRHVQILDALKKGMDQGLRGAQLSAQAGIPNFFLKEYTNQLRHWNDRKINRTVKALRDTDLALKSSPVSSHIWLENLVIQTCQP